MLCKCWGVHSMLTTMQRASYKKIGWGGRVEKCKIYTKTNDIYNMFFKAEVIRVVYR